MKYFFLRKAAALACVLGLAACGGGNSGQLQVSLTLVNVTKTGLTLQNNGGTLYTIPVGSVYSFPDLIPIDGSFDVAIGAIPDNTTKCEVQNGKAKATNISLQKIRVVCTLKTYNLGGTISGLNAEGLILANGTDQKAIGAGSQSFNMTVGEGDTATGKVPAGVPFGVVVFQNPVGLKCTVSNGTGTMPADNFNNIAVSCAP